MKTDDLQWYHLFELRGTRRDFLRAGGSAAALVAMGGALPARRGDAAPRFRADPFTLGVASGDPMPDGVVLWTRLAADTVAEAAGLGTRVPVRWEVADDEAFRRVARRGEALALPELGHSVHAEVEGLEPGRVYHYRFTTGGAVSPVGRTRTAPAAGAPTDRLRFAFASCQNFEHGHYTAYRHMAEEDLDLVVHLGDYIYEKRFDSAPTVREHEAGETLTLEGYRARYAHYRRDPHLRAAHAAFPWVVTQDDHEVDNNWAGPHPEDDQERGAFLLRRAAAFQTWYEFMPLRRSSVPRGPDMRLYRRLAFGDLLSLSVLDTRQHRSDQACGDRNKPYCAEAFEVGRTMLGDAQERWMLEGLATSEARWNVLANQVMVSRLQREDEDGTPIHPMDMWDGYPAARQRLLDVLASGRTANPVVLTGDIHSSWVSDIKADFDRPRSPVVGTELVGTSITSGGDGREVFDGFDRTRAANPHIHWYNGRRGYVAVDVERERMTARYQVVPWVSRPDAPKETRATFVVRDGRPGAVRE
ncbi:MAG: alkaline phosphatase D family protein [Gemmatimonadetes bacterium]|nr:alkaline phosphatase D family protein [Gemmatimonadota bacterium]